MDTTNIDITNDHIWRGLRPPNLDFKFKNPIALAVKQFAQRAKNDGTYVSVSAKGWVTIVTYQGEIYRRKLSEEAQQWQADFNAGRPVSPFTLQLNEIPSIPWCASPLW